MSIVVKETPTLTRLQETTSPVAVIRENFSQGAPGQDGADGALNTVVSREAAAALSGHRAVITNALGKLDYADSSVLSHMSSVLGITTGAIAMGDTGPVQTYGELTNAGWAWTPQGAIYLSTGGNLTQTAPAVGFVLVLGWAVTATIMFIDIKQSFKRG